MTPTPFSSADSVETLTVLIERSGTDITADYADWCSIAFALANEFGTAGEPFFQRISAFYPNFDPSETSKQYAACLNHKVPSGKAPITIGTLFHIASKHGIRLQFPPFSAKNPSAESAENLLPPRSLSGRPLSGVEGPNLSPLTSHLSPRSLSGVEGPHSPFPLPTFSQTIRSSLPTIMQSITSDSSSDVDADILILGSLTVISACIPNVYGVYDQREVFPNLFLYVTAPASAGKGRLSLCRHLAAPLHQALREKYRKLMKKFDEAQAAFVINRKNALATQPVEPPFLTLFVPANSTATVVYKTLSENNGVGLIFETEGDTLANAFSSDLGNYSDGFRKAFHHETISYLRKKDHEYVEILKPKFSAVLSGTPQQIFSLIPDAENGLFSRFIFYTMETELVWHDIFACSKSTTADEKFKQIGQDFYAFLKKFPKKPVQFTLSHTQQAQFNDFFEATQLHYAQLFGDEIVASVRRLGLILFRITMILSVLRQMDDTPLASGEGSEVRPSPASRSSHLSPLTFHLKNGQIVCTDTDFQTALSIVKVLLSHTTAVYQTLPRKSTHQNARRQLADNTRQRYLAALPDTFDRATYIATAASLNIIDRTAERYISDLCKSGLLQHPSNGLYTKNTPTP